MIDRAGREESMNVDSPLLPDFKPTDVQLDVLKDPSRRLLLTAANRFGKTVLGMLRVLPPRRAGSTWPSWSTPGAA